MVLSLETYPMLESNPKKVQFADETPREVGLSRELRRKIPQNRWKVIGSRTHIDAITPDAHDIVRDKNAELMTGVKNMRKEPNEQDVQVKVPKTPVLSGSKYFKSED